MKRTSRRLLKPPFHRFSSSRTVVLDERKRSGKDGRQTERKSETKKTTTTASSLSQSLRGRSK